MHPIYKKKPANLNFDEKEGELHNDTDLPVFITEYDISTTDDDEQLALYQMTSLSNGPNLNRTA